MGKVSSSLDTQSTIRIRLGVGAINVFGPPWAGKDTQCDILAEWLGASKLGGGDILRQRTDLPQRVREVMDRGELIPIDDYLAIVTPYLADSRFADRPLVFSSVGRFHGEEPAIMQAADAAGHPVRAVIALEVGRDTVRQRWVTELDKGGRGARADDSLEALEVRLDEYDSKTAPVIDYYRQAGLLLEINGEAGRLEVSYRINRALFAASSNWD